MNNIENQSVDILSNKIFNQQKDLNFLISKNKKSSFLMQNWKPLNLLMLSLIIFFSMIFEYSSSLNYNKNLEVRKKNLIDFTFSHIGEINKINNISEIDKIVQNINNFKNHSPVHNYIQTLNEIASLMKLQSIKINEIIIEENLIKIKLVTKSDREISILNDKLQTSELFSYDIKSIENIDSENIIINLNLSINNLGNL